jgi:hypothetical protein
MLKKILGFFKDLAVGLLFLTLSFGFMLLVASAMHHFRPQDYFTNSLSPPMDPQSPEAQLALRYLKWGATLTLGSAFILWISFKIDAWWKKRQKATPPVTEAAKEPV